MIALDPTVAAPLGGGAGLAALARGLARRVRVRFRLLVETREPRRGR
jgi:hypothetical protein